MVLPTNSVKSEGDLVHVKRDLDYVKKDVLAHVKRDLAYGKTHTHACMHTYTHTSTPATDKAGQM